MAASACSLHHAQYGVEQHHHQDDEHLRKALVERMLVTADSGGGQQNQQHRVLQLLHEALEIVDFLGLLQAVGAVLRTGGTAALLPVRPRDELP